MSKMKKMNILSKTIVMALCMFACADLDLPNDGRISYQELFSTYNRIKSYYNQCVAIQGIGFNYANTPLASFCDEAHDASDMTAGSVFNWYNDRTSPTSDPLGGYWGGGYTVIGKCNTFLKYMTDPELPYQFKNPDEKDGLIAQVRVARAYYYLQLIKRYGGCAIVDVPYEVDHDFSKVERATFEEVADFIIAECDIALAAKETEGMPFGLRWAISDTERGQITRAFAYAVKSQTALYAASPLWYTPGSKYTWEKATAITKEALDQCLTHGFQLHNRTVASTVAQNPYAHYFMTRSDASRSWDRETIFESDIQLSVWSLAGLPVTTGMTKAGPGPSQELVDSYEMQTSGEPPILGYSDADHLEVIPNLTSGYDPNNPYVGRDPRFYASIYYNGAIQNLANQTPIVETYVGGNCGISDQVTDIRFTRTGYYMRKFNNYRSDNLLNSDGYMRIFRLGELYLNFAEAAYQSVGPDVPVVSTSGIILSARDAVNAVRRRAEMPNFPAGMTKENFEKKYRNERRVELAFEEHRFYDVRRWKILHQTDGFVTGMRIIPEGGNLTYNRIKLADRGTNADKYLILPLDAAEAQKMETLTGEEWQNPGW
ncbi:MAG: RagB/SusD family nutrient uptake outer membrane protein [Bacteroidales bacterium]|nr:RagB/SusD family nutrient uptake outer membrane protein [Bacteroidales bacterium]